MIYCVFLTNTTDVYVHAQVNYIHLSKFLSNLIENCIILPKMFWIKVKPD